MLMICLAWLLGMNASRSSHAGVSVAGGARASHQVSPSIEV
jgi:hypothetical protein